MLFDNFDSINMSYAPLPGARTWLNNAEKNNSDVFSLVTKTEPSEESSVDRQIRLQEEAIIRAEDRANEEWWKRQFHLDELNATSIQRAYKDWRAAGLNPLGFQGQSSSVSSASPVSSDSPDVAKERDFVDVLMELFFPLALVLSGGIRGGSSIAAASIRSGK